MDILPENASRDGGEKELLGENTILLVILKPIPDQNACSSNKQVKKMQLLNRCRLAENALCTKNSEDGGKLGMLNDVVGDRAASNRRLFVRLNGKHNGGMVGNVPVMKSDRITHHTSVEKKMYGKPTGTQHMETVDARCTHRPGIIMGVCVLCQLKPT
jgi:hypothetical protein